MTRFLRRFLRALMEEAVPWPCYAPPPPSTPPARITIVSTSEEERS